ncbi:MAG: basic amino acid ABC transporter substrate-binding protein [Elusimicrobiota bacterium]
MRKKWYLIVAVLMLMTTGCFNKQEPTLEKIRQSGKIVVGTDATYPPFETKDVITGKFVGFDIDLVTEIARRMGVTAEFMTIAFDGIIPALQEKKFDMLISAMTITEERGKQVAFTLPYYNAGQSITVREDSMVTVLNELAGKKIGVQLGTTGEMESKKVVSAEVVSYDDIASAFIDLQNKKIDAIITDHPTSRAIVCSKKGLKIVGGKITSEEYGMALRKEDTELLENINKIITELKTTGWLDESKKKWKIED